ncbi:MAG: helix-turn-helix transcriptional regulator [Lawsonibacter sp.]|nr:helix-turn-helix transcriptional regulator [Lawsonibacter sp.]MCI9567865.1 helix-turn-helix transcriptional regulator [Lawsonibacter sp.]
MKTNLRQARKDKGLTQQQLADRVYVTSRTIIALEKEEYNPSLMLAYRLSLALDVPMEELFDLRENKEKEDKKYEDL